MKTTGKKYSFVSSYQGYMHQNGITVKVNLGQGVSVSFIYWEVVVSPLSTLGSLEGNHCAPLTGKEWGRVMLESIYIEYLVFLSMEELSALPHINLFY